MNPQRIFPLVGISFGAVFILVNAGGLPAPWDVVSRVAGVVLVAVTFWFGVLRRSTSVQDWDGSPRVYWTAVGAELIAIPIGAAVLNRVFDRPELVVLWVVFVVGMHFLPARAFGIGHYAELGVSLMVVAIVFALVDVVGDVDWAAAAGAVLAGFMLVGIAAIPPRIQSSRNTTPTTDRLR